jgi:modulator of FtsH protease HflK
LAAAANSFYIIEPAERGVVQRFGAYSKVVGPGLHFKLPWIDTYQVVNVDQVNKFVHRAQMLTKDENIVDVTVEVQFRIQDAPDFLFQDANPGKTIHGAMESALREVIGKSDLDDIMTENRSGIALAVQKGTQDLLNLYRTGLVVTNINIQDAQPPEAVRDAFADAIKAREDKERLQNQAQAYANDVIPRARGAAARLVEDAKAYKAKVGAEAEGESQRFLSLLTQYQKAPKVTHERLYLETMQDVLQRSGKVLLEADKGNNITYLPLDQIMKSVPAIPKATGASSGSSAPGNTSISGSGPSGKSSTSGRNTSGSRNHTVFSRDRGVRP